MNSTIDKLSMEAERLRRELAWQVERHGTREEQESYDERFLQDKAYVDASTPEEVDAQLRAFDLDPEQVRREGSALIRAVMRAKRVDDELKARDREISELRCALAAAHGRPEGAPSAGWCYEEGRWIKPLGEARRARISVVGGRAYWAVESRWLDEEGWIHWDVEPTGQLIPDHTSMVSELRRGHEDCAYRAMVAADAAVAASAG